MTSANNNLLQALRSLVKQYNQKYKDAYESLPTIEFDKDWPSPCERGKASDSLVFWQPIIIEDFIKSENEFDISTEKLTFSNVESALSLSLHQDIKDYFSGVFSTDIEVECQYGKLSLLFPWNMDDFQRLQENIIGHLLMKQRLKQAETIFFAVTDEEDMIISLDNATGEVWLEQVGCKPHKKLSNSLVQFIKELKPVVA